ncbi:hypothetical protein [Methanosarcina sp. 2.H.A.1B.4]|uniref:hypothetical protein n=1 Tax=Methanosarcina sp. 2.H.A.1B.4 TaxID=1483600 RepID=UPI0012E05F12|nr:hypothetical protein [Methanosarcina sp. 2.H.A.1B.4]
MPSRPECTSIMGNTYPSLTIELLGPHLSNEKVKKPKHQVACSHPTLKKLSENSISGQKHLINKVSKAFKSKKKEFDYY